jgi:hypothetical protein
VALTRSGSIRSSRSGQLWSLSSSSKDTR